MYTYNANGQKVPVSPSPPTDDQNNAPLPQQQPSGLTTRAKFGIAFIALVVCGAVGYYLWANGYLGKRSKKSNHRSPRSSSDRSGSSSNDSEAFSF